MENLGNQTRPSKQDQYNQDLFTFIENSPTSFHAASNMAERLEQNGFQRLKEQDAWNIATNHRYYVMRNTSSLIAFAIGDHMPWETGINLAAAHTDSPCLKVKPLPEKNFNSTTRLAVEVYGGALLNTWFDRRLNLAGRVTCLVENLGEQGSDRLASFLINFNRPVGVIPSLAIHLDREANTSRSVNPQVEMAPLFYLDGASNKASFKQILFDQAVKEHPEAGIKKIVDFDMSFSSISPPGYTGLNRDFITGPALDNLLSCHAGMRSLMAADTKKTAMLVCTDHEEIGSDSYAGARGSFLSSLLARIAKTPEQAGRTAAKSVMISWDNAHAAHPSHGEKHDANHLPRLNKGPVLKVNAALKYASDSESSALFKTLCTRANTPWQTFVMRSDMPCGSTTGPLISSRTGIKTVDAGAPSLAMHSISELTGAQDPYMVFQVTRELFAMKEQPLLSLT
ncbi:MAG: M18 family aminopeptidase [Desulfobacteraceae bacterium]